MLAPDTITLHALSKGRNTTQTDLTLFGLLDIASLALGTTDTPASTALLGIACIIPGAWWFYCTAKDKQHRNWLTVWAIVIVLLIVVIIIEW